MKKKNLVGTISILVIAIIGCVLITYGFSIFRSPKNITITTVDTLSKNLFTGLEQNDTVKAFYEFIENTDKIRMQANLDLTLDEKLGLETNQFGLDFDVTENKESEKSSANITYSQGLDSLVMSIIAANDKAYLMVQDAFKRYYYEDQEYQSLFSNIEYVNYDIFRELFIESLKNSLEDKDFTSEKTTININEEDIKVTKNSIALNQENTTKILDEFFKQLQNNEEAMNTLVSLTNQTKEELVNSMNETVTAATEETSTAEETFPILSVYIKGFNEVLLTELGDEDLKFQYYTYDKTREFKIIETNNINDNYDYDYDYSYDYNYDFDYDYTIGEINNEETDVTTISIKFTAKDDKTTEVSALVNGTNVLSGTITNNGTEKLLDFNLSVQSLTFHLTGSIITEEIATNSEYHTKLDLTATATIDQEYEFHFVLDAKFSIGEEIDTTVLEGALPMDEMTQEDALALYNIPIIGSFLEDSTITNNGLTTSFFA